MTDLKLPQPSQTELLEKQIKMLQAKLRSSKATKKPIVASIHTAKDSGKYSIKIGNDGGFRQAYLNVDQVEFILNNADAMRSMASELRKVDTVDLTN